MARRDSLAQFQTHRSPTRPNAAAQLRRAGIDARLHVWEGMRHSFEWYHEVPEAGESMREIAEFLGGQLRAGNS